MISNKIKCKSKYLLMWTGYSYEDRKKLLSLDDDERLKLCQEDEYLSSFVMKNSTVLK